MSHRAKWCVALINCAGALALAMFGLAACVTNGATTAYEGIGFREARSGLNHHHVDALGREFTCERAAARAHGHAHQDQLRFEQTFPRRFSPTNLEPLFRRHTL